MLTQEQIAERVNYIGGSDAAGVLGLSRWSTPLSIWAAKTGQIVPEDISEKLHVKLGHRLEEVVAELFMEKTGKKVHRVNKTIVHPKYPFLAVNVDRRVVGEESDLECKTASAWKAKEWEGEEIPHEYIIQCLHTLAVTGKKRMYIAVLIGNQDFKWKVIERDEKVIADIIRREVDFWNEFVIPNAMPSGITRNDKGILEQLFPSAEEGNVLQLDDQANAMTESVLAMREDLRNLEGQIDKAENELRALIGKAEAGVTDRYKIFWSNVKSKRLNMDALKERHPKIYEECATEKIYRKFLIKELKENDNG